MPAELDKDEAKKVQTKSNAAATIKRIIERDFGGTCNVNWDTGKLEIDVPKGREMDCAMAIEKAMKDIGSDACDLGDDDMSFFIADGDPNEPIM